MVSIFAGLPAYEKCGCHTRRAIGGCRLPSVAATRTDESYVPALAHDRLTGLFDPMCRLTMREGRFRSRLLEQAAIEPGQRVLDIGCGTATLAIMVKRADRKSTRLNSSHANISYAVFCLKKTTNIF